MREDNRFEIERALDLLPHVTGGSWAMVWFRLKGIRNPTSEEFRDKVIEFFLTLSPLLESFKTDDSLNDSNSGFSVNKNSITLSLNSFSVGFLIPLSLNQIIAQLPPIICGKRSKARSISNF